MLVKQYSRFKLRGSKMIEDAYTVKIGNEIIGHGLPTFIIAEIGINHNGSMDICKKLIDMAVSTGCDAVKFQKRNPDICVPDDQKNIIRETPWGKITYLEYKKKIEFGKEEYIEIDRYCKEKGIIWFASPWDVSSVDFLEQFDVPCYKIASACLTDEELLKRVKATKKPVILSTGMSTMQQINDAIVLLGDENLILLHCNSTYPAATNELNLNVINTFRELFKCPIGYSGHESITYPSVIAAVLGACVIERHITLDRAMYGTDQAASLELRGLQIMCSEIRNIPIYLGTGNKTVYDSEQPLIQKLRLVK